MHSETPQNFHAKLQRTIEHLSVFTLCDCVADPEGWFKLALDAKFGEGGYDANERGGPAKSPEFLKWMASRGLDLAAFKKWQADGLPRRFYFPLVSDVREGKLVRVLTDKGQVV